MNLDFIAKPLGQFLYFIYSTLKFLDTPVGVGFAYGLAIIIFTVIIKAVLLPLTVKQYRSTAKMQEIQPQIKEIQTRYKNDKEKLNAEMMKVYAEHKVNPAGGCLPLLIQMPILFSLYWIIAQPMKLMLGKTQEQVGQLVKIANVGLDKAHQFGDVYKYGDIALLNHFNSHTEQLAGHANLLKPSELINFNFLGLHLGESATYIPAKIFSNPSLYLPLLFLVILSVAATFISTKMSMPQVAKNNSNTKNQMAGMQSSMMYIAPVMTLFISFSLPAGLVLYWTVGYIFTIFQQLYINKHVLKKKEAAI
jgi:YidC/Oxa1 family membrane protein insertase